MTQPSSYPYPDYAAAPEPQSGQAVLPGTPPKAPSRLAGILLVLAGVLLAVAQVVLAYALIRWAPDPLEWFLGTTVLILVLLAVLAVASTGRRALSAYVAIALLLPFLGTISAVAGLAERADEELSNFWGSDDTFGLGDLDLDFGDLGTGGDSSDPEAGAETAVPLGEAGEAGAFSVVVSGLECTTKLRNAADNPDYFTDDDAEQFLDVKAEKGEQFCIVSSTWKNISKEPNSADGWNSFAKIVDSEGNSFGPSDNDYSYAVRLADEQGINSGVLNPGATTDVISVFSVPADAEFTHAVVDVFDAELSTLWFEIS